MGLSQLLYPLLQEDPIPSRLHSPLSLPLPSLSLHIFALLTYFLSCLPPNTPPLAPLALQPPYPAAGPHDGGKNSSFHQSVNGGGRGRRQGWALSAREGPLGNVGSWSPPCSVIQLLRWVTSVSGSIIPNIHREPAAAKQCNTALKR